MGLWLSTINIFFKYGLGGEQCCNDVVFKAHIMGVPPPPFMPLIQTTYRFILPHPGQRLTQLFVLLSRIHLCLLRSGVGHLGFILLLPQRSFQLFDGGL